MMKQPVPYDNDKNPLDDIPVLRDVTEVFLHLSKQKINYDYIQALDDTTGLSDQRIAEWLNITTRTLHNYRTKPTVLKQNTKEHIVLLLSLYKHGIEAFGRKEAFEQWLSQKNILLDGRAPQEFLDTISGIYFIDNRLTAIEYGENV